MLSLVGISLNSCKKEGSSVSQKETNFDKDLNIKSDGRMLIFKSTEDYQKVVENPTEDIKFEFISKVSKMKHVSYTEKLDLLKSENDSLIGDDYLAQILNEDWIVQIGNYLYRVNKPEEKVYVLPVANIDEYDDLVNQNLLNPNIRKFSTFDNCIELAESGDMGEKCNEHSAKSRQGYGNLNSSGTFIEQDIYVNYNNYGINFSIKIKANNYVDDKDKLYIQIENLWYKKRCGTTYGPYSLPWASPSSVFCCSRTYDAYSGITPLHGYHVKARARFEDWRYPSGSNPYTIFFTSWAVIEINSPY